MNVKATKAGTTMSLNAEDINDLAGILADYQRYVPYHRLTPAYVRFAAEARQALLDARPQDVVPAGGAAQ
jgi:hypothetical protein